MNRSQPPSPGQAPLKTRRLIWFVLLASIGMYFFLSLTSAPAGSEIPADPAASESQTETSLLIPLYVMGLLTAGFALLLPRWRSKTKGLPPFSMELTRWVLADATACYGLILEMMDQGTTKAHSGLPLLVLGLLLLIYLRPKPESVV